MIRGMVRRTRAAGGDLTGPDGLLKQITTTVETALEEELVDHLEYDKYEPVVRNLGNSRNCYRAKAVVTESCGEVTIDVPRDRDGRLNLRSSRDDNCGCQTWMHGHLVVCERVDHR